MKTDLELLTLAARAAGISIARSRLENPICADLLLAGRTDDGHAIGWNPLTKNSDAFRLKVCLLMMIDFIARPPGSLAYMAGHVVAVSEAGAFYELGFTEEATRRAIVRAAAAMAPILDARANWDALQAEEKARLERERSANPDVGP